MKRTPALPIQPYRPPPTIGSDLVEAEIVSQQPGTNLVDVRLSAMGQRVVRNVRMTYGTTYQAGDTVLAARTAGGVGWVCIARVQDPDQYGLDLATSQAENELHPPTGFTVYVVDSLVVAEWQGWAGGGDICFKVQHNSSATGELATEFFTWGSYCLYRTTVATTRHFRAQALRYDVGSETAYYSAWTAWASATSAPVNLAAVESGLLQHMHTSDWMWTKHMVGELP